MRSTSLTLRLEVQRAFRRLRQIHPTPLSELHMENEGSQDTRFSSPGSCFSKVKRHGLRAAVRL